MKINHFSDVLKISFAGDSLESLICYLNETKEEESDLKSRLPNIISLDDEKWGFNFLFKTMMAMIKQKKTCRKKLMRKLYDLYQ